MKVLRHILAVVIFSATPLACSKDQGTIDIIAQPSPGELITNGSFEINGSPSLQGWKSITNDSSFVNFSTDVPLNGGGYSVRLKNEWGFPGFVSWRLKPPLGIHRYRLSVWGKAILSAPTFTALGSMGTQVGNSGSTRKAIYFSDSLWTVGSMIDTLVASVTDTLIITLRGDPHQFSYGYALFDLCEIEWLD